MAISKEDKKDVKDKYGKALANKVEKATRDYGGAAHNKKAQKLREANPKRFADRERRLRAENDRNSGKMVKLRPTQTRNEGNTNVTAFSPYRKDTTHDQFKTERHKGLSVSPTHYTDAKPASYFKKK